MAAPESANAPIRVSTTEQKVGWAIILLLLLGCFLVLRPFVLALLWAIIFCSASWPLYLRLLRLLRNRTTLAAWLMTLGMASIVLLPLVVVGATLADDVTELAKAAQKWFSSWPPQPPEWLGKLPVVGASAVNSWQELASDTGSLVGKAEKWIPTISSWLLKGGLLLGHGLLQIALSIFISFFLFRDGVSLSGRATAAVEQIGGEKGVRLLGVARNTVKGVVYGIMGTALLQAVVMGLGLLIASVPGVALLALITFFSSIVPILGTGMVWIPVAIWLFHKGSPGLGVFIIAWGLVVSSFDNVVRPWLISHGSRMPFLLIFFGVIGGIIMFGFIGLFLGPALLAIGFRIAQEWMWDPQHHSPDAKATK